jgi:uncharacterized protein (TIGR03790 family)
MAIAARNFEDARALIDRGVASDGTRPAGTAYLLFTSDAARNVRHLLFPQFETVVRNRLQFEVLKQDALENARDVMMLFTGSIKVAGLETLGFLPGAAAELPRLRHVQEFHVFWRRADDGGFVTPNPIGEDVISLFFT